MTFPEEWGYVDDQGQVWQKDCQAFKGRQIGRLDGKGAQEVLAYYALRFEKLEQYYEELQTQFEEAKDKPGLLDKINRMLDFITESDAIGDFDGLLKKLMDIKVVLDRELSRNLDEQEELYRRVEQLLHPDDWHAASEEVKAIQARFKKTGPVPESKKRDMRDRFRAVCDEFFENRRLFYAELDREKADNYLKKEDLCRKAEELGLSSDWKVTAEELKHLMEEWKKIGPVTRGKTEDIWRRFKAASDTFFQRREAFYKKLDEEREDNLRKKITLCERSEELSESDDWHAAAEELKQLQEAWKHIGSVPKKEADAVWLRFKRAHDHFFERRHEYFKARDEERLNHLKEKQLLCEEAESLFPLRDLSTVREQVKDMQRAWKNIGAVPSDQADALWLRFKTACDRIFQGDPPDESGDAEPG